jgi:uncharacterized protein
MITRDPGATGRDPADGPACRLTVFVRSTDLYRHRPLYAEIVHRAHKAGLSGASVFRGILGFSAPDLPRARPSSGGDTPVFIAIVDAEHRIRAFLPVLDELVDSGIAVVERTQVRRTWAGA